MTRSISKIRLIAIFCALSLFAVQPGFAATKSVSKLKSAGRTANSIPNTILNGTSAPAKTIGINGDFYIDTKNLNIYGPKKKNAWPLPISLRGAAGTAGSDGKTGTAGVAGADGKTITNTATSSGTAGATGATGLAGATGSNGAVGATGSNGTNGSNGAAGSNGAVGETGVSGSAGPAGPPGPAGATGATGATGAAGSSGSMGVTVSDLAPWRISTSIAGTGTFFAVFPLLEPNKKYIFTIMVNATRVRYPGEIKGTIELNSGLTGLRSSSLTTYLTTNVDGSVHKSEMLFQGTISVGVDVDSIKMTVVDTTGHSLADPINFTGIAWLTEVGSIT